MSFKMFDGNDLPHQLLLTTRQITKLRNALNNNMSTDIKRSKAHISKIIQSAGFLGSLLSKLAGPLMKVAVPLAKNVFASLGIIATASAIDAGIQKKIHGNNFNNFKQRNDIMKIVQALEDSMILLKGLTKTIENETKEQKGGFLSMLLGTLGASLLGNILARKGIVRAGSGHRSLNSYKKRKRNCKNWLWKRMGFLIIPPHPLKNFEIQQYHQNEPRFNGIFHEIICLKK